MAQVVVSARDANQRFAEILGKAVDDGQTVIITRRGEPVAQLVKYRPETLSPERQAAGKRLMARLEKGVPIGISETEARAWKFDRDEAHER
jgi:prevent-host-death family protein